MLNLSRVTLTASTTRDHDATEIALAATKRIARFAKTVLFSDRKPTAAGIVDHWEPIDKFGGYLQSSVWAMTEAPKYTALFKGTHILAVQWDGFAVNPAAWDDSWLEYDFVAPPHANGVVGNTGFWLVSIRYLEALAALNIKSTIAACHPHDARLSYTACEFGPSYRGALEAAGMRYAPPDVARKFAASDNGVNVYTDQFGFHGRRWLPTFWKGLYMPGLKSYICHNCGRHYSSEAEIPKCPQCHASPAPDPSAQVTAQKRKPARARKLKAETVAAAAVDESSTSTVKPAVKRAPKAKPEAKA